MISTNLNGVVQDLARHPIQEFAVILEGQLIPIRFATMGEAIQHLRGLRTADGETFTPPPYRQPQADGLGR